MLIQKTKLEKNDVVVLKLTSPPVEIVARLEEDYEPTKSASIAFKRPLEARGVQYPDGGIGLAFVPFSLSARDDQIFRIDNSTLFVPPFPARDEVLKSYTEQTSSLKLPD